jgi:hypothetical protein
MIVPDFLSFFSSEKIIPAPYKETSITSSLAHSRILSIGHPTTPNPMPDVVALIHPSNNNRSSLRAQLIQNVCDTLLGLSESPATTPRNLYSPMNLIFLEEEPYNIRDLESPTISAHFTKNFTYNSTQKQPNSSLTRNPGSHGFSAFSSVFSKDLKEEGRATPEK